MVTQYDLELFTRIEKLVEMKMEAFPVEPADIALISDRVEEARKMACAVSGFGGKRRDGRGGEALGFLSFV